MESNAVQREVRRHGRGAAAPPLLTSLTIYAYPPGRFLQRRNSVARGRPRKSAEPACNRISIYRPTANGIVTFPRPAVEDTFMGFCGYSRQHMYPTFLKTQRGFSAQGAAMMTMIANLGALVGGILVAMTSDRISGTRRNHLRLYVGISSRPRTDIRRDGRLSSLYFET